MSELRILEYYWLSRLPLMVHSPSVCLLPDRFLCAPQYQNYLLLFWQHPWSNGYCTYFVGMHSKINLERWWLYSDSIALNFLCFPSQWWKLHLPNFLIAVLRQLSTLFQQNFHYWTADFQPEIIVIWVTGWTDSACFYNIQRSRYA